MKALIIFTLINCKKFAFMGALVADKAAVFFVGCPLQPPFFRRLSLLNRVGSSAALKADASPPVECAGKRWPRPNSPGRNMHATAGPQQTQMIS